MFEYTRKVNYYETDKMGITHHSNYIRFLEEARVAWMDNMNFGYKKCEDLGFGSPVLAVNVRYKKTTTFDDEITIGVFLKKYNGVKITVGYILKKDGEVCAEGETEHCFVSSDGRLLSIKKEYPELDKLLVVEEV